MSSIFTMIAVYALLVFGILFCFFGRFPGQILAYAGLLLAHFTIANQIYPIWLLVLCGVLVVASIIVNKTVAPKLASKVHEYGKAGKWGTIVGSILSLFCFMAELNIIILIILFFVLPYLFAFVFELIAQKNAKEGAMRALGAYTHFATTTLINLAISAFCFFVVLYGWIDKAADEVDSVYDKYESVVDEYMGDTIKGIEDLSKLMSEYEADATKNINSLIKKYQAACKHGEVMKAAQMMTVLSQYEDKLSEKQQKKIEKATLTINEKYLEEYEDILKALANVGEQDDFDDKEDYEEPTQFSSKDEAPYLKMVDRYEKLVEKFISKQKKEGSFDYELYEEVNELGGIIKESIDKCSSGLSERFNKLESMFSNAAIFGSEGEDTGDITDDDYTERSGMDEPESFSYSMIGYLTDGQKKYNIDMNLDVSPDAANGDKLSGFYHYSSQPTDRKIFLSGKEKKGTSLTTYILLSEKGSERFVLTLDGLSMSGYWYQYDNDTDCKAGNDNYSKRLEVVLERQ